MDYVLKTKNYILGDLIGSDIKDEIEIKCYVRKDREHIEPVIIRQMFEEDSWRLKQFKEKFGEMKTIVDIGGHIGMAGLVMKQHWPDATLLAYEPNKVSSELYNKNMLANKISNFKVFNMGVSYDKNLNTVVMSDQESTVSMLVTLDEARKLLNRDVSESEISDKASVLRNCFGNWKDYTIESNNIKTITLEEIINNNDLESIDILKLDCEGAEIDLIVNCDKKSLDKIKCIMCEYHISGGLKKIMEIAKDKFDNFILYDNLGNPSNLNCTQSICEFWAFKKE